MSALYRTRADCEADPGHRRAKVDYATWVANTAPIPTTGERTPFETDDPEERAEWGHCATCNSSLIFVHPPKCSNCRGATREGDGGFCSDACEREYRADVAADRAYDEMERE